MFLRSSSLTRLNEYRCPRFCWHAIRVVGAWAILFSPLSLLAQTTTGKILGIVEDSSGAVVPNAAIKVTHVGTNVSSATTTNASGYYEFLALRPGEYQFETEVQGFKKFIQRGITLQVNQQARIDVILQPGEIQQLIEVTGQPPLLETTASSLGQVVSQRQVLDLPLNGRNPFQLMFLSAGVSALDGGAGSGVGIGAGSVAQAGLFGGTIAASTVNGGRQGTTEVFMDGAPNTYADNSPGTLGIAFSPSVDSIQEFKVITNNMSAEFGNAGAGAVNIVTRSGGNDFHGSVYEFHRNSVFDANNFFANKAGIDLKSFKRNQFGGVLGGAILRDKTFFFVDYEGTRERKLDTTTRTVPVDAWRRGDFSGFLTGNFLPPDCLGRQFDEGQLFNPFSLQPCPDGFVARDPFPGNVIPNNLLSSTALAVTPFWPNPNQPGTFNNFVASGSLQNSSDQFSVRIDHILSDRQRLMGRYAHSRQFFSPPDYFGTGADPTFFPRPGAGRLAAIEHSINFSPTTLLTNAVSYNRNRIETQAGAPGFDLTEIGQSSALNDQILFHQFPYFVFNSVSSLGVGFAGSSRQVAERFSLRSALTKIQGRHSMKFGSQIDLLRTNEGAPAFPAGSYFPLPLFVNGPGPFDPSRVVGVDFASFMLGLTFPIISQDVFRAMQSWYTGFYFQDDIKISRKLTLNVGVRYDLAIPATERYDRATWFDFNAPFPVQIPADKIQGLISGAQAQGVNLTEADLGNLTSLRGGLRFAGDDSNRHWFDTDRNNIQPRFGFAYQVTDNWVLRGGGGLFFGPSPGAANGTSVAFNIDGFGGFEGGLVSFNFINPLCQPAAVDSSRRYCLENPYPGGLTAQTGSSLGLLTDFDPAGGIVSMERHTPSPVIYNWNFSVERMLPGNILVAGSYVGSRALRFATGNTAIDQFQQLTPAVKQKFRDQLYNIQVPNPFSGIVQDPDSHLAGPTVPLSQVLLPHPQFEPGIFNTNAPLNGQSSYHAFQLRVQKAFSHGLSFLVSYTNGKLIDNGEGGLYTIGQHGQEPQDRYRYDLEKAVSSQDVSQRLVFSNIYELPFGKGKKFGIQNPVINGVLGGWQINSIVVFGRGTPVPWGYFPIGRSFGLPFTAAVRPNEICDPVLEGPFVERLDRWFNTECFEHTAEFALGTAPRIDPKLRFPGVRNMDFSIFKTFDLTERWKIQFRAEFFNLSNTPRFAGSRDDAFGPGLTTTFPKDLNPAFGRLDIQSNDPRQIQFGLKINF